MKGHMGLHMATWVLIVIGALNWLLVGLFSWDIGMIFGGPYSVITRLLYLLIGLSGIYELIVHKNNCKLCSSMGSPAPTAPMGTTMPR